MFDLMGAIRQRQKAQTPPLADSAETAESPQPRAGELAEGLRKTADKSAGPVFSATIRSYPQTPETRQPPETKGSQGFSANPQNPQTPTGENGQSPDAVLAEIARTLKADTHMLRRLLSPDDLAAIAEGDYTPALLAGYFRAMESAGHSLVDPQWHLEHLLGNAATRARQQAARDAEWEKQWRAAHDSFIGHVMGCQACYAPRDRYCTTGAELRRAYRQAYRTNNRKE